MRTFNMFSFSTYSNFYLYNILSAPPRRLEQNRRGFNVGIKLG
jgi:hypothetical protein